MAAIAPSLIGVMGAGLLVFVQRDLETVVEVNQGQKAFEVADAGVQAARRQLLSDANEELYDNNASNGDSPWSSRSGGRSLTFDGNNVNVKVQYLLPSDTSPELTDANHAPELTPPKAGGGREFDYPEPRDFFKVTSEGTAGGARRKIEAIYSTEDLNVPKGYYTPGNITVGGSSACIDSISLFALGNITFDGDGGCTDAGNKTGAMKGKDTAYADWDNPPFNTTARPTDDAGAGAVGNVEYKNGASSKAGTRDFDGPDSNEDGPEFVEKEPPDGSQDTDEISFPFDHALPDIDFLRDKARTDGTYYEVSGGAVSVSSWPSDSDSTTVVFYKFTGSGSNTLKWSVSGTCTDAPPKRGTLVVENGNFTMQPSKALFRGAVVVRGGEAADGTSDDAEKTCLEGFVNAEGSINIAGNVSPMSSEEAAKRPGWYDARLWSWREVYE